MRISPVQDFNEAMGAVKLKLGLKVMMDMAAEANKYMQVSEDEVLEYVYEGKKKKQVVMRMAIGENPPLLSL